MSEHWPAPGTAQEWWWLAGARAEAAARAEGRSEAGLEVIELVDVFAGLRPDFTQAELAGIVFGICIADLPWGRRIAHAWRALRRSARR